MRFVSASALLVRFFPPIHEWLTTTRKTRDKHVIPNSWIKSQGPTYEHVSQPFANAAEFTSSE